MLFEYSLNNLAFVRYSKMQLLLPLIPKMFLGFLGPQNSKNDKIYFRIIIRFIRYGHYPVTSLTDPYASYNDRMLEIDVKLVTIPRLK